jgi:hypothetical protein
VTFIPFGSEYVSCEGTVNAFGALPAGGACFCVEVSLAACPKAVVEKGSNIAAPNAAAARTRFSRATLIHSSAPLLSVICARIRLAETFAFKIFMASLPPQAPLP